jgi:DNA invertase Pin-like site-specific DNA recombinase
MLTILGGLAEFEREFILARTDEGRERSKARGVNLAASRRSHVTRRSGAEMNATRRLRTSADPTT